MMLKVYDFVRSSLWYIVDFIYGLMDTLIKVIKELNAFDIINSLSDNAVFQKFYHGVCVIAVTLFALFVVWKFVNKILDPDDEITIKTIVMESFKCGALIMLSTFMFAQVSSFSITLSNYTSSIFDSENKSTVSNSMLSMFISYDEDYKKSKEFKEPESIENLVKKGKFKSDELYLAKYVSKSRVIFSDTKDYKYKLNWVMAILCGGFFLYSLFFAGITLGRRQIEFLFLFAISPIVFATSVCNKQRRGMVIEQMVSLVLQSCVVLLIVSLSAMVMQQVNLTTFFTNNTAQDILIKTLLYLGCAIFVLTGSDTITKFIGSNISASSGKDQIMSLMGYGKLAGGAGAIAGATAVGGGLLATGGAIKAGNYAKNSALSNIGMALGTYGQKNSDGQQTRMQKMASAIGTRMHVAGQRGFQKSNGMSGFSAGDAFVNAGASSINSAVRKVMPRASYNASYYRRRKNMF